MNIRNATISLSDRSASAVGQIVRFLAESAQSSNENKKSDNAARGGVLNYRYDELDDGADSTGWYGDD